jgi:hypothetical protein
MIEEWKKGEVYVGLDGGDAGGEVGVFELDEFEEVFGRLGCAPWDSLGVAEDPSAV